MTTTKGRELIKVIGESGCDFNSSGKPTYWPTDRTRYQTSLARKDFTKFYGNRRNFDLDSDHWGIVLILSEKIIRKEIRPTLVIETTDWESFRINLQKK